MVTAPEFVIADPESSSESILLTKEGAEDDGEQRKAVMLTDPYENPVILSNLADPEKDTDAANKGYVKGKVDDLSHYLEDLVYKETIQVSGAKVGQFLKVKVVDENGVPTAWETAKIGDEWEEIINYTLPENSAGILMTEDKNGNPFDLKEAFVVVYHRPELLDDGTYATCNANVSLFDPFKVNKAYQKYKGTVHTIVAQNSSCVHQHGLIQGNCAAPEKTASGRAIATVHAKCVGDTALHCDVQAASNGGSLGLNLVAKAMGSVASYILPELNSNSTAYFANDNLLLKEFCSIKALVVGALNGHFGAGSIFKMYGIRK